MTGAIRDRTAVVGVGATPYYKRGRSYPRTELELACAAVLAALEDAGLTIADLDGFAIYSYACDPAEVAATLGVPEVRFAASLTAGGGGSAGSLGLAAAAITSGMATTVVSLMAIQQRHRRVGGTAVGGRLMYGGGGTAAYGGKGPSPLNAFTANSGILAPRTASPCWPVGTCTCTAPGGSILPRCAYRPGRTPGAGPTRHCTPPL